MPITGYAPMRKIGVMLEPTNRCQLRCTTCFSHQDGRAKTDMPLGAFRKLIAQNASRIKDLSLYNYGEPLLNRSIAAMVHCAKESGIAHVKLATNGMVLTEQKAAALVEARLDHISISLDGASAGTYTRFRINGNFNRVVRNIARLVKVRDRRRSGLIIELQFIIMKHNEHEIAAIEALARKLGVDVLRLKTVLIKRDAWKALLPREPRCSRYAGVQGGATCDKPREELVINADGTVIPCCYVVGKDVKKFAIGNIKNNTLDEIMRSGRYLEFVAHCRTNKDLNPCCRGCDEGRLELDHRVIRLKNAPPKCSGR